MLLEVKLDFDKPKKFMNLICVVDCNIPKYKIESISTIIKLGIKSVTKVTFCVCVCIRKF